MLVKSSCISIIVESSFDASLNTPVGISEIVAKTEIDGEDGLLRLAADLDNATRRRQAAMLLTRSGRAAVSPIKKTWKTLKTSGRRLAIEVLGEVDPVGGMDLLIDAVLGTELIGKLYVGE